MSASLSHRPWHVVIVALLIAATGCAPLLPSRPTGWDSACNVVTPVSVETPKELQKAILPTYLIEPPDILSIDIVNLVPKSPYRLRTLDVLAISVTGALPEEPIVGQLPIQIGGLVQLGVSYGSVAVAGKTLEEAEQAIEGHLRKTLKNPDATVSLLSTIGQQQIAGEHMVGPDGTVTLGSYGSVGVVGLSVDEAKQTIEAHLNQFLENPEISLGVFAYNSKLYYVILQGGGNGDQVLRFPVTGNETILDAISQVHGLTPNSSTRIWIGRPGGSTPCEDCILPVDWHAISQRGRPETNYQILPGDRIYVAEDKLIRWDTQIAKITAPFERIFGFTLLGTGTVSRLSGKVLGGGGARNSSGGGF